jgi:Replication-relaxation
MNRHTAAPRLAERLGPRDLAILRTLQEFRLMTGGQIRRLYFYGGEPATEARKARAACKRLVELGVIVRTDRRVGGIRAGSEGFVFGLSGLGAAVLDIGQLQPSRHRRVAETKPSHQTHVLGVSELAVRLTESARTGEFSIDELRGEPGCWRWFSGVGGGQRTLKPDTFLRVSVADYELASFVEVDLATESLPTVLRKCMTYIDYWKSGAEQRLHDFFPRVWWLVPHTARLQAITDVLKRLPDEARDLFRVVQFDHAITALTTFPDTQGGAR